jgi:ribosomal-protein-alanine N-acetyltransferase
VESLPSDERGWFDLVLSNQAPLWRLYADACRGEVITEGDVQATAVPQSPNRSFFNSVFYSDTDTLIEQLPRLAEAYEDAGVNAWTVWIPATDGRARDALGDAGHKLDATPRAMGFELTGLQLPDPDPEIEIREEEPDMANMDIVRRINETAYGYPPGDFPPIKPMPDTGLYLADLDGETVGTTLTWERGLDTEITFVATLPEARGRGIAKRLMGSALQRARESGKTASTLIATKLGFPVYTALGYRDVGGLEMWERRN